MKPSAYNDDIDKYELRKRNLNDDDECVCDSFFRLRDVITQGFLSLTLLNNANNGGSTGGFFSDLPARFVVFNQQGLYYYLNVYNNVSVGGKTNVTFSTT